MRPDAARESARWLRQAEHDLGTARLLNDEHRFSDVCFHAQQAAEKAVKAVRYRHEPGRVFGHDLTSASGQLRAVIRYAPEFEAVVADAAQLDQYYITPRYPDAFPGDTIAPYEAFSAEQAADAITRAERILQLARDRMVPAEDEEQR